MKILLPILVLYQAIAYCNSEEGVIYPDSLPCAVAKIVVEETPEVTYFRIIADSGETLLDINSNYTYMNPFDVLLTSELLHPDFGHWVFAKNTRYYITRNQTTGRDAIRLDNRCGLDIFKSFLEDVSVIKSDLRCATIHDFSLVIDPAFDIMKQDDYRMTALLWSSWFGLGDLARQLIERGADVNQGLEITPVMAAILSNQPRLVEFLIRRGANVVQHEGTWLSTLHIAALVGNTAIAEILIGHGVNVNEKKNRYGLTPLHLAVFFAQCDTLKLLLKKGADINTPTCRNMTSFELSLVAGHLTCGRTMLEAGADVNARDDRGNTALIFSMIHHEVETKILETIDRFLREFNPDVNIKNNKGETALAIANRKNFTKITELLKSKGSV